MKSGSYEKATGTIYGWSFNEHASLPIDRRFNSSLHSCRDIAMIRMAASLLDHYHKVHPLDARNQTLGNDRASWEFKTHLQSSAHSSLPHVRALWTFPVRTEISAGQ